MNEILINQIVDTLRSNKIRALLSPRGQLLIQEITAALCEQAEDDEYLIARRCPNCEGESVVIDSRENPDGTIMRRRECLNCGQRFRTREVFDHIIPTNRRRTNESY